jgi:hypothetical protein
MVSTPKVRIHELLVTKLADVATKLADAATELAGVMIKLADVAT